MPGEGGPRPGARSPSAAPALASRRGRNVLTCAHRGASATHPENTLAAFAAAKVVSDYVETDVRHTADGVAILHHDKTLRRTTDVAEVFPDRAGDPVETFTAEEVAQLDAGSWLSPDWAGQQIPTLRQGLDALAGSQCGMLLEVKTPILDLVRADLDDFLAVHPEFPIVVGSVHVDLARNIPSVLPDLPAGVLFVDQAQLSPDTLADYAGFARFLGFRNDRVTPETVSAVHAAGLQILHNTNTARFMIECAEFGADGTVTDHPAIKACLAGAGDPIVVVEASDVASNAIGPAPAYARNGQDLPLPLPFKTAGSTVLTFSMSPNAEWCEVTLNPGGPAWIELSVVTGPAGGRYAVSWDDVYVTTADLQSRSPARRLIHLPEAAGGKHRLRFTLLPGPSHDIDWPLIIETITLRPTDGFLAQGQPH